MSTLEHKYRIPCAGRVVLLAWGSVVGVGVVALFAWHTLLLGGIALGGVLLCLGWLWLRSGWYQVCLLPHGNDNCPFALVTVHKGRWLRSNLQLPCRAIYAQGRYATPLLHWAGCSLLLCQSAGRTCLLLPLADADVAALQAAITHATPYANAAMPPQSNTPNHPNCTTPINTPAGSKATGLPTNHHDETS